MNVLEVGTAQTPVAIVRESDGRLVIRIAAAWPRNRRLAAAAIVLWGAVAAMIWLWSGAWYVHAGAVVLFAIMARLSIGDDREYSIVFGPSAIVWDAPLSNGTYEIPLSELAKVRVRSGIQREDIELVSNDGSSRRLAVDIGLHPLVYLVGQLALGPSRVESGVGVDELERTGTSVLRRSMADTRRDVEALLSEHDTVGSVSEDALA
jgi:hypothetical protein